MSDETVVDEITHDDIFEMLIRMGQMVFLGAAIALFGTFASHSVLGLGLVESTLGGLALAAIAAVSVPALIYTVAVYLYTRDDEADLNAGETA